MGALSGPSLRNLASFPSKMGVKRRLSSIRWGERTALCPSWVVLVFLQKETGCRCYLKGQCHEIFASGFFHESLSPQPHSIPLRQFKIFSKIRGDICKSRCTTGINNTGGKFATSVNDTGGKQWDQLSNCWQLKMNLKFFYLYANSTTQRCPK